MPIFLCERTFATPLTPEQFAEGGKALAPCIAARDVAWLSSNFAADGSRSICMFEAADAERVREANRTAGMPFERVYAVNVYKP
jgi:Protein of unknown function (DUF4242)